MANGNRRDPERERIWRPHLRQTSSRRYTSNAYLFMTHDAAAAGNIVNQVHRDFNGLGHLTKEYQSPTGAVNTGATPKVQHTYSEMADGANHSRLTSTIDPNGRCGRSRRETAEHSANYRSERRRSALGDISPRKIERRRAVRVRRVALLVTRASRPGIMESTWPGLKAHCAVVDEQPQEPPT